MGFIASLGLCSQTWLLPPQQYINTSAKMQAHVHKIQTYEFKIFNILILSLDFYKSKQWRHSAAVWTVRKWLVAPSANLQSLDEFNAGWAQAKTAKNPAFPGNMIISSLTLTVIWCDQPKKNLETEPVCFSQSPVQYAALLNSHTQIWNISCIHCLDCNIRFHKKKCPSVLGWRIKSWGYSLCHILTH